LIRSFTVGPDEVRRLSQLIARIEARPGSLKRVVFDPNRCSHLMNIT